MKEFSPEELAKLKAQIAALGEGDCDNRIVRAAQRIAEPEYGGSEFNVYAVLPQIAKDALRGKDAAINVNKGQLNDTGVQVFEITAAALAAARIAKERGIQLEEVPIEDIATLSPAICEKLQGKNSPECKPSRTSQHK